MKTSKRIWVFLLLGVMLAGFVLSGCTPEAETTEPDPNAIALRDLPFVNLEDISEIDVYYGEAGEPIRTLKKAKEISTFKDAFEKLRFTLHDMNSAVADEYSIEAFRLIRAETTYRIEVKLSDGTNWNLYVAENNRVFYEQTFARIYASTTETDYIGALGIEYVLNQSYIEGCTYAGITKSMVDSILHTLEGEENVDTFFDTFLTGIELTDDSKRVDQVWANIDLSGFPFQICFTGDENNALLVCLYENGAITVDYEDQTFASVQDNVIDRQAMETWLKKHGAL